MPYKKNIINKKIVVVFILLAILAPTTTYIFRQNNAGKEKENSQSISDSPMAINNSPTSEDIIDESSKNKNSIINDMGSVPKNSSSGEPISVAITRASRTNIGVYIEKLAEGKCNLSIIQNGIEKIAMNAQVIVQSNYSTCEGFFIDSSRLDSSPFTVSVKVSSGDRSGSAKQEVQ